MIKKIYIHIGLPKVASTSIQRSLAKSASFLKQKGILYPVFNINNKTISNHHVFFINRIFKNAENFDFNKNMGLINSKRIEEVNELLFKQFIKQLNSFEGNTLVFSGEFISFFNLQQLNAIKQFLLENINSKAKIEIIVFIRNPVNRIESVIQQKIKDYSFFEQEYKNIEAHTCNCFRNIFEKFEKVFEKESIKLIQHEIAIKNEFGPVGELCSFIGIDPQEHKKLHITHANKSVSYEALILLSSINKQLSALSPDEKQRISSSFKRRPIIQIPGCGIVFPESIRKKIWELSYDDLQWLNEYFELTPYTYPEQEKKPNENMWSKATLQYIEDCINKQPQKIKEYICNEILIEFATKCHLINPLSNAALIKFINSNSTNISLNILQLKQKKYASAIALLFIFADKLACKILYKRINHLFVGNLCKQLKKINKIENRNYLTTH